MGAVNIGGFRLIRAGKSFKYNVYVNVSSELRHADALAGLEVWMTMAWMGVSFIGMRGLGGDISKVPLGKLVLTYHMFGLHIHCCHDGDIKKKYTQLRGVMDYAGQVTWKVLGSGSHCSFSTLPGLPIRESLFTIVSSKSRIAVLHEAGCFGGSRCPTQARAAWSDVLCSFAVEEGVLN